MQQTTQADTPSFLDHAVETGLARIAIVAVGLGTTVVNARWLGVEGVGALALLLLLREFAFRYGNLGFGSAFAFFTARGETTTRYCVRAAIATASAASLVCIGFLSAIWQMEFSPWRGLSPALVYTCIPTIPLVLLVNHFQRILSGKLRIRDVNVSYLLSTATYAVVLVVLVAVLELRVLGAVLSVVASDLVTVTFLLSRLASVGTRECANGPVVATAKAARFWRYGRWNYLLMLLGFFTEQLPLILLKKMTMDVAGIGLFSRARGLGVQFRVVVQPFTQVLFPYTAASTSEQSIRRTNALCRTTMVLMFPVVVAAAAVVEPTIRLMYGSAFVPAAEIFYAMTPALVAWPADYFLGIHLAAAGFPGRVLVASASSVLIGGALAIGLIPRYGPVGAGLSMSAIFVLETLFRSIAFVRTTDSSWAAVFIPRPGDRELYRRLAGVLLGRVRGSMGRTNRD